MPQGYDCSVGTIVQRRHVYKGEMIMSDMFISSLPPDDALLRLKPYFNKIAKNGVTRECDNPLTKEQIALREIVLEYNRHNNQAFRDWLLATRPDAIWGGYLEIMELGPGDRPPDIRPMTDEERVQWNINMEQLFKANMNVFNRLFARLQVLINDKDEQIINLNKPNNTAYARAVSAYEKNSIID